MFVVLRCATPDHRSDPTQARLKAHRGTPAAFVVFQLAGLKYSYIYIYIYIYIYSYIYIYI